MHIEAAQQEAFHARIGGRPDQIAHALETEHRIVNVKRDHVDILIGAGPVLSYYEFKHPMDDRLTDEQWTLMLENEETPARSPGKVRRRRPQGYRHRHGLGGSRLAAELRQADGPQLSHPVG